jgi:hypothetical protein
MKKSALAVAKIGMLFGVLLLTACGGGSSELAPSNPSPIFVPTLELATKAIHLMPSQTYAFSASINYPPNTAYIRQPVSWSVVEPEGGRITPSGSYTAPASYGTYHVKATREDYPQLSAIVDVTVGTYQSLQLKPAGFTNEPEQLLIRDQTTWAAWRQTRGLAEIDPNPANNVDFSKHMVASIVLAGQGACDRTVLREVKPEGDKLVARITVELPPPNTTCIAMVVYPNWVIAVPKSDLPLGVVVSR